MIEANKLKRIEDCKGRLKEMVGDEGVLQLARDGVCPHYILTNPITKEETLWFVPSEINDWFDNNFVRYNEGYFTPKYDFLYFNKDLNKISGVVPDELLRIKDLYELPLQHICTPPGIYFLCKGKSIQYIGQASSVSGRILTHISEGLKDFDAVYFISCPINRLNELESALIRYFAPPLNRTCRIQPSQKDVVIVDSLCNGS